MITNFFEELCSKLNIDWSDIGSNDLFSETELVRWLNLGKDLGFSRHPWPMTEGRREIAVVGGQEKYAYSTDMKTDGIRYLTVNDKRYEKKSFEDYMIYREDNSAGTRKFFTDYNRTIYINYLASDFGNSIVCYAQVEITGAMSSATTTSVFTMAEPEADEAIVKLAYSRALGSEKMKNPSKAIKEKTEALEILDGIWNQIVEKQHTYQTHDRPMFKRMNVLNGGFEDDLQSRNQF